VLNIALVQCNPIVGDLAGNAALILHRARKAFDAGARLIAFPELVLTGYPPEDLLLKKHFVTEQMEHFHTLLPQLPPALILIGLAWPEEGLLYNAAAAIHAGECLGVCRKIQLPNYGVFDEKRYFTPGRETTVLQVGGSTVGVQVCEDLWVPDAVTEAESFLGDAEVVVNLSASPYHFGKREERLNLLKERARKTLSVICYCNLVGGQDELVFDGESFVVGPDGSIVAAGRKFEEDLIFASVDPEAVHDLRRKSPEFRTAREKWVPALPIELIKVPTGTASEKRSFPVSTPPPPLAREEEVYRALTLGLADYVKKNGFQGVILGLSGGIDSALVAAVAVDALGPATVRALFMPSRFTSNTSREDALALAENLGITLNAVPIEGPFEALLEDLAPHFQGRAPDTTEENLQARLRGILLMAFSNKFGHLVLTTGNKSETSVGYCTLYGDMAGGFAVIKDVPKTLVYALCRWRNAKAGIPLIPERILTKAPTAELKANQTDQDSLPPYEILDRIIHLYVEEDKPLAEITAEGFEEAVVRKVIRLVDAAEYKRRQAPPGIKITPKAFGRDRRMPITDRFRLE
jgi:NAD+ synthase (glutamine-hydrolysing)